VILEQEILQLIKSIFWHFAWLPIFFILLYLFHEYWMYYVNNKFWRAKDWALLEIKLPQRVPVTPKATEQMLAGLHGACKGPNLIEKYWDGYIQARFSLEIVGINGEIHFFIRTERKFRNLVEAQVYAQYPEAEIFEIEDYTKNLPFDMPDKDRDLWGSDLVFIKDEVYPIRTHPYFKEIEAEEGIIDPLASFSEIFSHLRQGEQIWMQILIEPTHDPWQKKSEQERDKLIGAPEKEKPKSGLSQTISMIKQEGAEWGKKGSEVFLGIGSGEQDFADKKEERQLPSLMQHLSPGTQDKVKAVESKATKLGFNSKIRFIYIGTRDIFTKANVSALSGAFKQYSAQDLNGFMSGLSSKTSVDYFFEEKRKLYRKRKIYMNYRYRSFDGDPTYILNIEELASIFHLPGIIVQAPSLPRVEAKKGGPPAGLPIG
tara:strand:+ start:4560 stop:5849 length:1290 start_codon:yes stop_codon:yes gene_type:complete